MSEFCVYSSTCEAIAFFDEAKIVASLSDDSIEGLGWEAGTRIVMAAALDTMDQIGDEGMDELYNDMPSTCDKCDSCYMNRNDTLRLLLEDTPDSPELI